MTIRFQNLRHGAMLLLLVLVLPGISMAQGIPDEKLPAKAKSAFESAQSSVEADWEMGPQNTFEAHFSKSGKDQVYVYDKGGNLSLKKQITEAILLPTSIGNTLAYDYPTGNIQQVYRVVTRKKTKYYEVHITDPSGTDRVHFNLDGSLMAVVEAPVAPATQPHPSPILASSEPAPSTGTMRGEAPVETEADLELIDDDIADLFEEEEDGFDIDAGDDDDWEDVMMEEDEVDIDDTDLENWDVVEDSESPSPNQ